MNSEEFDVMDEIYTKRIFSLSGKMMRNKYTAEEKHKMWNEIKTIQMVRDNMFSKSRDI